MLMRGLLGMQFKHSPQRSSSPEPPSLFELIFYLFHHAAKRGALQWPCEMSHTCHTRSPRPCFIAFKWHR